MEGKPPSLLEIASQLTEFQREPPSATSNLLLETRAHTPGAQAHMRPLLVTQKMAQELELDYHQDRGKLFQEAAELQLELLQVEAETRSQL